MIKGISLHLGLNYVDPNKYNGWDGELAGCQNDARAMQMIAAGQGFQTLLLVDDQVTADTVICEIGRAAKNLKNGDIFFLSYSGHGSQIADADGDEADGYDETWCLWDREIIDDELYAMYGQFEAGVRVVIVSDSCHSGTVSKMRLYQNMPRNIREGEGRPRALSDGPARFRVMPEEIKKSLRQKNTLFYAARQWGAGGWKGVEPSASIILISGCLDNQLSSDGSVNGLFTEKLLEVWDNGSFSGGYEQFWKNILSKMPPTQSPNYYVIGASNSTFEQQKPFSVGQEVFDPVSQQAPSIQVAGDSALTPTSSPPNFNVETRGASYYIVEFATSGELFDSTNHGSERTDENFYGSWSDTSLLTTPYYPMPLSVWNALKNTPTGKIYYRVGTTTSATGWENYRVSTSDYEGDTAPALEITQEERSFRSPIKRETGYSAQY